MFCRHMAIYELDPDVVCWGLHLLDDCTLSHHYSPSIVTQYDPDLSQVEYVTEGFCQHQYVDSDEAVAQAYQEELWQLVSMVASGNDNFGTELRSVLVFCDVLFILFYFTFCVMDFF